jgi:hypothetical protein
MAITIGKAQELLALSEEKGALSWKPRGMFVQGWLFFMPTLRVTRYARLCKRAPSHIEPASGMPKRKFEKGEQRLTPKNHQSATDRLVHRRLRHARSERGEGAAR